MSVSFSALMCHAPIVVPAVGGERGEASATTTAAMRSIARRIVSHRPDVIVVASPHTPRLDDAFSIVTEAISGDFARFGVPARDASIAFRGDDALVHALQRAARAHHVALDAIRLRALDHGATVPLWFLAEAGYDGPVVVVGLPAAPRPDALDRFARAIADAAGARRVAFIASGDCSHRLQPGAPAGFHPIAGRFDLALRDAIAHGGLAALDAIDDDTRELAAEDAWDTARLGLAVVGDHHAGREVLSYEGPYGVGYLCAVLYDADEEEPERALLDVARDALEAHLQGRPRRRHVSIDGRGATGVFVTWRAQGALRGCIGTLHFDKGQSIDDAVAEYAVAAATRDPRFPPVDNIAEARALSPEVTLLDPSEPVDDLAALDPKLWGVEVSSGWRRGVLLPDIEGVDTVDDQLRICKRKAGIADDEPIQVRRFRARKIA